MYSTHNEGKSLVGERFFRTLKWISQYIKQAVHTNFADSNNISMKNVIKRVKSVKLLNAKSVKSVKFRKFYDLLSTTVL